MSKQELPIQKKVFIKDSVLNVVDRNFTQLIKPNETVIDQSTFTIEDFFKLYDELFFDIPKEGDTNSHQELVTRSSEYLGIKSENSIDIQLLLDEITQLRQELLDANETIANFKTMDTTK